VYSGITSGTVATRASVAGLYVGTSGWSYPSWRPGFYPAGTKPADFLRYYAQRFPTVELNTTAYRLPPDELFPRWADQAPPGFRFAPKMNAHRRFDAATFDGTHICANKCFFCFLKGLPKGMRRTLYVKDDDYRLSFLHGNFVTLTNLSEDDWRRMEQQRLSPINVSVHATELALRRRMLGNAEAPDINALQKQYRNRGFVTVGVDEREDADKAKSFVHKFGLTYKAIVDANGDVLGPYGAIGLPVHVFIDRRGTVKLIRNGEMSKPEIESAIKSIL